MFVCDFKFVERLSLFVLILEAIVTKFSEWIFIGKSTFFVIFIFSNKLGFFIKGGVAFDEMAEVGVFGKLD